MGGKEYALLKVAAIFPADVLARFHIEVFFSINPLSLKQRHLVFLSCLLKIFGIQPDSFGQKKDQPLYAAVADAIRYIEQDRIVFALYRLMSAYQHKLSAITAQRASLEDALYMYKEQLVMDVAHTFGQRIRHILGLTGILYAFVSRARPTSSRSTSTSQTSNTSATAGSAATTPVPDPQREQRELKKLLEEVDHPVHFTYALASTLNYSTASIWRDLRTYCMYDEAKHLLQQVLQTEEEVVARETITDGKKSLLVSQQDIYTIYALLCDRYYTTEKDKRDFTYELKLSLYTCFPTPSRSLCRD